MWDEPEVTRSPSAGSDFVQQACAWLCNEEAVAEEF